MLCFVCAQHPGAREEPIRLREEGASPTLSPPWEEEEEEGGGRKEDTHSNGVRHNSWCMLYIYYYTNIIMHTVIHYLFVPVTPHWKVL